MGTSPRVDQTDEPFAEQIANGHNVAWHRK